MTIAPSPALTTLFGAQPEQASNPVGTSLHSAWVNLVEVSTPGELDANVTPSGFKYADLFFGTHSDEQASYTLIELTSTATAIQGILGAGWWTSFAYALVTQAIYNNATSVRPYTNESAVTADL